MVEKSDPDLLAAYRKQLERVDPELAFLAWQGQKGITEADLLDEYKRVTGQSHG